MSTDLVAIGEAPPDLTALERVMVAGDLSKLSAQDRWEYYKGVCRSMELNPFTQPFAYLTLNGKMTLYALKGATDQLRGKHRISISKPTIDLSDGLAVISVTATDQTGRQDSDLGIVPIEGLKGDAKANAIMKAITKAKRRVTLSMLGLGMLDETEVDTIPGARTQAVELPPDLAPAKTIPAKPGSTLERFAEPEPPAHVAPATGEIIEQPDLLGEPSITDPAHPHWQGWLKLVELANDNENIANSDIPDLHLPIRISDLGDAGAALKAQLKAFQTTR
jgi:hypothetical protein